MSADIIVPALGESITEATVARWLKAVGEPVAVDDPLVELETDKVTLEVNAVAAGTLSEIIAAEGANVEIGAKLGMIAAGAAGAVSKPAAAAPEQKVESTVVPMSPAPSALTPAQGSASAADSLSPAVQRLVAENQVNPSSVAGTGKDGRILKGDVLDFLSGAQQPAQTAAALQSAMVDPNMPPREERVKMPRLRQRIAERLKDAQNTAAILTTFNEIDMSAAMALRTKYKEAFEKKHGVRLGFMSLFIAAVIAALKEVPAVNAEIDGDHIIYKNHYDIGVAVGTEQGLVVPVIRDADKMNLAGIESAIGAMANKARSGKLSMADLTGGTFTISNGGVYGSLMSTPILNPPQSGILGMHKIEKRPVVVDGEIKIRPMMYVALSYDHRIIDGSESVTFLVRVKEALEDPQRLLLSV